MRAKLCNVLSLIFLDTETTGFDPKKNRLIEVALCRWEDGHITDRFETLVDPQMPIPAEITLLTGIRNEDVSGAPRAHEVAKEISEFIGSTPVVGHNIAFDMGFLRAAGINVQSPQIDTVVLARCLLLKEDSYALEVLMKRYKLPLRDSHRAMADTETAVDFFNFLVQKIREFDETMRIEVIEKFKRSAWAAKIVFEFALNQPALKTPPYIAAEAPLPESVPAQADGCEQFFAHDKMLVETAVLVPLRQLAQRRFVIAYASARKRDEVLTQALLDGIETVLFKEGRFYLSPQKLTAYLAKESFSDAETAFGLKMILWSRRTLTGDREELSLTPEEIALFEVVADTGGIDIYYKRVLDAAATTPIVLMHQYGLANGLHRAVEDVTERSLIIYEASCIEDSLTNAVTRRYSAASLQRRWGDAGIMLAGLIGIFYEKMRSRDPCGGEAIILNESYRLTSEWQRVIECAANLPDCDEKEALGRDLAAMENSIQSVSYFFDQPHYTVCPLRIDVLFQEICAGLPRVLLASPGLSGDGTFRLIRKTFGLDDSWAHSVIASDEIPIENRSLLVTVPDGFPEPNAGGYCRACTDLFTKLIETHRGRCLFILSSKKAVEAHYRALLPIAHKRECALLAMGLSGGAGKTMALFREHPDRSIILATAQITALLPQIEHELEAVVFQKIPFDHLDNPIFKKRSEFFEDSFSDYSLPRAIMKFRELLWHLGKDRPRAGHERQKQCYILDSRILRREYGKYFM